MKLRLALLALFVAAACGGGKKGTADASHPCGVFGTACTSGDTCCSGVCDPQGACSANPTTCGPAGNSCSANTDCCSVSCIDNVCSDKQCVSDGGSCSQDNQCCGGICSGGTCQALNASCKTDGNSCAADSDCCSQKCNADGHCGMSSYCVQDGDACAHDTECCGGICDIMQGHTIGLCTHPMPGSTNCSAGIDGTVCNGCGDCCSRLCQVYAPTGVKICQPAEGCHVDGDLCRQDSDCCGAPGTMLPGDGNVHCLKVNPTDETGICRNPRSCNPEGNVCHYLNYPSCDNSSSRNDCCGCISGKECCQLDTLGIPRCNSLGSACRNPGETCSYSGDCCNGAPCVPDASGTLHCGGSSCVMAGGTCTNSADCCAGTICIYQPGQEFGTCGATGSGSSTCANDGQACTQNGDCCNMDCNYVDAQGAVQPCNGGSGCTCFSPIF